MPSDKLIAILARFLWSGRVNEYNKATRPAPSRKPLRCIFAALSAEIPRPAPPRSENSKPTHPRAGSLGMPASGKQAEAGETDHGCHIETAIGWTRCARDLTAKIAQFRAITLQRIGICPPMNAVGVGKSAQPAAACGSRQRTAARDESTIEENAPERPN